MNKLVDGTINDAYKKLTEKLKVNEKSYIPCKDVSLEKINNARRTCVYTEISISRFVINCKRIFFFLAAPLFYVGLFLFLLLIFCFVVIKMFSVDILFSQYPNYPRWSDLMGVIDNFGNILNNIFNFLNSLNETIIRTFSTILIIILVRTPVIKIYEKFITRKDKKGD